MYGTYLSYVWNLPILCMELTYPMYGVTYPMYGTYLSYVWEKTK